jgi:hypothetical protein
MSNSFSSRTRYSECTVHISTKEERMNGALNAKYTYFQNMTIAILHIKISLLFIYYSYIFCSAMILIYFCLIFN